MRILIISIVSLLFSTTALAQGVNGATPFSPPGQNTEGGTETLWQEIDLGGGVKYEGETYGGAFNGEGMMTYGDGSHYSGDWKDNMRHGRGTMIWANGNRYLGKWKDDLMHGKGTMLYASDSTQYYGKFANGKPHGKGKLMLQEELLKKGYWEKGKYIGAKKE